MLVNPAKHLNVKVADGQAFVDWLVSAEGQGTPNTTSTDSNCAIEMLRPPGSEPVASVGGSSPNVWPRVDQPASRKAVVLTLTLSRISIRPRPRARARSPLLVSSAISWPRFPDLLNGEDSPSGARSAAAIEKSPFTDRRTSVHRRARRFRTRDRRSSQERKAPLAFASLSAKI
jgi:hypothetical protein